MCRPPNSQKRKEIWKGVLDLWPLRLLFAAPAIDRVFDANAKVYRSNRFQGVYEIVSLVGTINTMNDAFYCHLHMCAADQEGHAFGGHLNEAVISATCELVVTCLPGRTDRVFSDQVGLNLISF